MPVEPATYINTLNVLNPVSTDTVEQGDDHIRLIKSVLKNTFPNITGPVTVTQDDLNGIAGAVPPGVITLWYGSKTTIPNGWALCDGKTYNKVGGGSIVSPDLRNLIVIGAGGVHNPGARVGADTKTTSASGAHLHTMTCAAAGGHNHDGATGQHVLTVAQMPAHSHTYSKINATSLPTQFTSTEDEDGSMWSTSRKFPTEAGNVATSSVGSAAGHSHSINAAPNHTHTISASETPAHTHSVDVRQDSMALCYIIKL